MTKHPMPFQGLDIAGVVDKYGYREIRPRAGIFRLEVPKMLVQTVIKEPWQTLPVNGPAGRAGHHWLFY